MAKTKAEEIGNVIEYPASPPIVKIGLASPFQIPGADVFTYVDIVKHRVTMTELERGILVEMRSKMQGPTAPPPLRVLVPWGNVTYVTYGRL